MSVRQNYTVTNSLEVRNVIENKRMKKGRKKMGSKENKMKERKKKSKWKEGSRERKKEKNENA